MLHRRLLGRCRQSRDDPGQQPGRQLDPGPCAEDGRRRDAHRDRSGRARAAGMAVAYRQGARRGDAQALRPHDREPGGSGPAHDRRAGQAADGIARRDRLCRLLHRMVRRGGQARLRRHHPRSYARQAHRRAEAADRGLRRDHAVELSGGDDHAQDGAGARLGLHHGAEAGDADPVLGAGAVPSSPSARACPRASSPASPAPPARSAAR